jgi:hypothetical protein
VPSIWLFPDSVVAIKVPVVLTGVAGIVFTYLLVQEYAGQKMALLVCLLTAINAFVIEWVDDIMTEVPFYACSMLGLYVFIKYVKENRLLGRYFFLTIATISYLYHIKASAIVMIIAVGMILVWLKQFKKLLLVGCGIAVLTLPWLIRNNIRLNELVEQGQEATSYTGTYAKLLRGQDVSAIGAETGFKMVNKTVRENIALVFSEGLSKESKWVAELVLGGGDGPRVLLVILGILAGLVWLVFGNYREDRVKLVVPLYFAGLSLLYLLVGTTIARRYLTVLTPLYLLFFLSGVAWILDAVLARSVIKARQAVRWGVLLGLTLLLAYPHLLAAMNTIQFKRTQRGYGGAWGRYYEAAQWLAKNTPPDNVPIISRKSELIYPWVKRYAKNYPITANADSMLTFLLQYDYIMLDNGLGFRTTPMYVIPVVQNNMDKFQVVYRTGQPYQYVVKTIRPVPQQ